MLTMRAPANACSLPGSTTERDLQRSFARMLPELLRFSSAVRLLQQIPDVQQSYHRLDAGGDADAPGCGRTGRVSDGDRVLATSSACEHAGEASVWSGWSDVGAAGRQQASADAFKECDGGIDDDDLVALGL